MFGLQFEVVSILAPEASLIILAVLCCRVLLGREVVEDVLILSRANLGGACFGRTCFGKMCFHLDVAEYRCAQESGGHVACAGSLHTSV